MKEALSTVDGTTAARLRPVLAWLEAHGGPTGTTGTTGTTLRPLRDFLARELPQRWGVDDHEQHEVAWALGDLFEHAGLPEHASLCRSTATHERIAVGQWIGSFSGVPAQFWGPALDALEVRSGVPPRAALSLSSAHALLQAVGDGMLLADDGHLPLSVVLTLDDRFRWTEEFPWMRATDESGIAPLRFLHAHLLAQRLLERRGSPSGSRLVRTPLGVACSHDTSRLWRAVVDPSPRWSGEFERDALGVMAASVLRSADFTLGRIDEELTHVLAGKWRPAARAAQRPAAWGNVFDGASPVVATWYQLGVPLGWWDTGRGPADRRPNPFGRAAAVAVLRAVAGPAATR